jgi:hypothetical protein
LPPEDAEVVLESNAAALLGLDEHAQAKLRPAG